MSYRKTNVRPHDRIYLPGGLSPGSQIIVRGRVSESETRFAINLQCGESDDADIAFHFNPRNDQGDVVVRNTRRGGAWQNEERDTPKFPFDNGRKFTLRIITTADCYRVYVNNDDFIHYNHRIPPNEVYYLVLGGGAEYYEAHVQNNFRAPFFGHFPGGLRLGQAVRVRGMAKDNAERFTINFNCDRDGHKVGFHFNPRQDEEDVVLNTNLGGWGEEKRGFSEFPFKRGEYFDTFIIATEQQFRIFVNEKPFTTFDYRCDLGHICHLTVSGDVELQEVEIMDPLPSDFVKEVPSGVEKDDLIVVKGFFYPEGQRFAINLLNGTSPDDDIALHINPRRDQGEIVFNSREGGSWEKEKRKKLPSAMEEKAPFTLEILAKSDKFKVFANDKKIIKFKARDNIESIKGISVRGEAYIYEIKLLRRLENPFVDRLPCVLESGSWIVIHGAPQDDSKGFAINLQCGKDQSSDIAFHFNPRFPEEEVVRNTREGGSWGGEERDQPNFPFKPEDRFTLALAVLDDRIRVFANNQRFADYKFRINPDRICHIMLGGDCDFFEPEFY